MISDATTKILMYGERHPAAAIPFDELVKLLDEAIVNGYVHAQDNGDLRLYTYTVQCTHENGWTLASVVARGLILDLKARRIVAYTMPKFFNLGEYPYIPMTDEFDVSEKMDGSLGIIYYHADGWHVATKGSFKSDQAIWAEKWLHANIDITQLYPGNTYLAEIIYRRPGDNKIVVTYPYEGLAYITSFTDNGWEFFNSMTQLKLTAAGFIHVPRYNFGDTNAFHAIAKVAALLPGTKCEGFVIRFSNGLRVKIKGDEYLMYHRLISECTPLEIWRQMADCTDLGGVREKLPEEFHPDFDAIVGLLESKLNKIISDLEEAVKSYADTPDRELGSLLQNLECYEPEHVKAFLFPCRKNEFLEQTATDNILKLRDSKDPADTKKLRVAMKARLDLFRHFRPTGNVLPGYKPTRSMNRIHDEDG